MGESVITQETKGQRKLRFWPMQCSEMLIKSLRIYPSDHTFYNF